jgi:NodT family efflux transporter outer membrane factor (OMF) lipoprotein
MSMHVLATGSRRAAALASSFILAACAVGPDYHRPALPDSASYGADAVSPASSTSAGETGGTLQLVSDLDIPAQWWEIFHSSDLDALVERALKDSPTIEAAKAALRAAREQVRAQRGAYYPTVSASIQPSHQSFAPTLASPTQAGNSIYNLTTTQVSVSYTPDLFGANERTVESLVAQADEQRYELEAARLTLASNVVLAAIQDALLRAEIDESGAIILDQRQLLASFQRQHELGQASDADMAAQNALLAQAEATLPPLQKQFRINRDLMLSLLGRTPGEPLDVRFDFESLTLPDKLPLSLPAQLVEHRPDVRIAEEELHDASAQVGIAVAARLPNVQIEATGGSAALGLLPSFNNAANFWSIAGTLTQPIFDAGTLLHKQRAAEAALDQAAALYRGTVVGAFQNTADALHALWTDADGLRDADTAEIAARKSLEIARRQLDLGDLSRLAVIAAEQAEDQAKLALLQARANQYSDVAALFQALGGGWWNASDSETKTASTAD